MKQLKSCAWALAIAVACGSYVFLYLRHNLDDPHTLALAGITGTFALVWFLYSITGEALHPLLTKLLVGCGALVATVCAGAFLRYAWTERTELQHSGILPFFAFICFLALGATVIAWNAFWNCMRSKTRDTDEPNFHP
jgi:hypothetical protein